MNYKTWEVVPEDAKNRIKIELQCPSSLIQATKRGWFMEWLFYHVEIPVTKKRKSPSASSGEGCRKRSKIRHDKPQNPPPNPPTLAVLQALPEIPNVKLAMSITDKEF